MVYLKSTKHSKSERVQASNLSYAEATRPQGISVNMTVCVLYITETLKNKSSYLCQNIMRNYGLSLNI